MRSDAFREGRQVLVIKRFARLKGIMINAIYGHLGLAV
jgi:hypothetical protein